MKEHMNVNKIFRVFLAGIFLLGNVSFARAANPFDAYEEVQILKGDIASIPGKAVTRVAVSDPLIVDVSEAKANEVLVVGNKEGQASLFIWDASGKRTVLIRVMEEDLSIVKHRIAQLLTSAGITDVLVSENKNEGRVVLSGVLADEQKEVFEKIILPFEEKVMNFVGKNKEVVNEDLVQIDMQITELSTTLSKALGVDWTTGDVSGLAPQYDERQPSRTGQVEKDLFNVGSFSRTNLLTAKVNAMITEGKAKILSKPRLVVVNGKEATFLVGGEVPIRTTSVSASGGTQQENVEYKEYGVTLSVTPTLRNGKVDIVLNVEISDIDPTHATDQDVAFLTRSAQTQLLLDDRQTIVLAGMIRKVDNQQVGRVPLLGSVPILGALFRSKKTPVDNEDREVVISLTPTILKSSSPQQPVSFFQPQNIVERPAVEAPSVVAQTIAGYAQGVQDKILAGAAFPLSAQKAGLQGVVKLEVVITRDGALKDVYIKESSGYEAFDQNALNTVQAVAPFRAFPEYIHREELSLTIPVIYDSGSFLKNSLEGK